MDGMLIKFKQKNDQVTYSDFIEKVHEIEFLKNFEMGIIGNPVYEFRKEFLDYIAEKGLSSLFESELLLEAITSPSMQVDEIKNVIKIFVGTLQGAKNLVIIDPYLFAGSPQPDVCTLFSELLTYVDSCLEKIYFITNGRKENAKNDMLSVVDQNIATYCIMSEAFHDRYWFDPDNNKGIVMGTSLNGIGRKIALVDKLSESDVREITKHAKAEGLQI